MVSAIAAWSLLFQYCTIIVAVAVAAQGRDLWFVAKNNEDDVAIQSILNWYGSADGADCGPIQKDGPYHDPFDLQCTASFAFNDYYLKHGPSDDAGLRKAGELDRLVKKEVETETVTLTTSFMIAMSSASSSLSVAPAESFPVEGKPNATSFKGLCQDGGI